MCMHGRGGRCWWYGRGAVAWWAYRCLVARAPALRPAAALHTCAQVIRQEKLHAQEQEHEARVKRALERAAAPVFKKAGKCTGQHGPVSSPGWTHPAARRTGCITRRLAWLMSLTCGCIHPCREAGDVPQQAGAQAGQQQQRAAAAGQGGRGAGGLPGQRHALARPGRMGAHWGPGRWHFDHDQRSELP
jgi:hypothetical protein